ncbi:MAG: rhomboid family intrarane serine protease [Labilithrix sp.]|nr:rhomboid family intrarane serine protease [Labilithrix sp.]
MLLPISHEKMTVRRLPAVTIAIIAVTIVAFVLASVASEHAARDLGYVPERANFAGLFTYMFAHANLWHLAGNMWFLFLCGLSLEDRWGRLAFGIYYVVAGVVAAGVHHLATSDPSASLVGASGAVAGAMGAFLVLFATTKIRFVGFAGIRLVSFAAPAYVMLPLWAVTEMLYGIVFHGSGTAHWAHVGGFAFGAVVAGGFRAFGIDRRLDDAALRAAVLGNDPRVDAARALVAKGEAEQAVALLEGLAKEKPESTHVQEALRDAASVARASSASVPAAARTPSSTSTSTSASVGKSDPAPFFPPVVK